MQCYCLTFSLCIFNAGMDIRTSSTDLTVLLIRLDSQRLVLRNNKTCTSVVRPLLSLTMCTSQKSPLFLQLIFPSIHTRQKVCETASVQGPIYHLSQELRGENRVQIPHTGSSGSIWQKERQLFFPSLCFEKVGLKSVSNENRLKKHCNALCPQMARIFRPERSIKERLL